MIVVATRLSDDYIKALDAAAKAAGQSRAMMMRELVRRGLGLKDSLHAPVNHVVHAPAQRARRPPVDFNPPSRTVIELFESGYGIQAIAALTHKPYAEITRMIGAAVDEK